MLRAKGSGNGRKLQLTHYLRGFQALPQVRGSYGPSHGGLYRRFRGMPRVPKYYAQKKA